VVVVCLRACVRCGEVVCLGGGGEEPDLCLLCVSQRCTSGVRILTMCMMCSRCPPSCVLRCAAFALSSAFLLGGVACVL
jgi:hypothetical protein